MNSYERNLRAILVPLLLVTDKEAEAWGREVASESLVSRKRLSPVSCRFPALQTTAHTTAALAGGHSHFMLASPWMFLTESSFVAINILLVLSSDNGHFLPQ